VPRRRGTALLIETLVEAVEPGQRILVVLAVRADFYGRCAAYPVLADLLLDNHALGWEKPSSGRSSSDRRPGPGWSSNLVWKT
jgi:hypothetical protein